MRITLIIRYIFIFFNCWFFILSAVLCSLFIKHDRVRCTLIRPTWYFLSNILEWVIKGKLKIQNV